MGFPSYLEDITEAILEGRESRSDPPQATIRLSNRELKATNIRLATTNCDLQRTVSALRSRIQALEARDRRWHERIVELRQANNKQVAELQLERQLRRAAEHRLRERDLELMSSEEVAPMIDAYSTPKDIDLLKPGERRG